MVLVKSNVGLVRTVSLAVEKVIHKQIESILLVSLRNPAEDRLY